MGAQDLINRFYEWQNLVKVDITMPEAEWTKLKTANPRGGFGYKGSRYDWYKATSVSVSGSKFPNKGTFSNVGIIKKSFAGSFSTTKPSFRLDFGKYDKSNEKNIEALIGSKKLTLNNSKQDPSYIRQPIGYKLFRQAGLPGLRCNLAHVVVNGTIMGVFVNIEPVAKPFFENSFSGNVKGNAYEIELDEDITIEQLDRGNVSFEGFSKHEDKLDLRVAAEKIQSGDMEAIQQVVDVDAFIKFVAMESLLKHWDGYTQQLNNTFVYNDTNAVANPTVSDVRLKFIASGIDQILQGDRQTLVGIKSTLGGHVWSNVTTKQRVCAQMRTYVDTLFSTENYQGVLEPRIDGMRALLTEANIEPDDLASAIDDVKGQLQQVAAEGAQFFQEQI